MAIVYLHRNKLDLNKVYVGYTTKTIDERWKEHVVGARNGIDFYFQRAIRKYGSGDDVWEHLILVDCPTIEDAKIAEVVFIAEFRSDKRKFGYNLTAGGDGVHPNLETRQKMSKSQKCRPPPSVETREKWRRNMLGEKNHNYGKKISDETRKKQSEAQKNMSPEKRAIITASQVGIVRGPQSKAHKEKISKGNKGKQTGVKNPIFSNGRTKLTVEDVIEIKSSIASISNKELSIKFGVRPAQIYAVRLGKVWKHVRPDLTRQPHELYRWHNGHTAKWKSKLAI